MSNEKKIKVINNPIDVWELRYLNLSFQSIRLLIFSAYFIFEIKKIDC